MLTKRELSSMAIYQLAGLIRDEYREDNEIDQKLKTVLDALSQVDYVEDVSKAAIIMLTFKALLMFTENWEGQVSRLVKWEIEKRIKTHEDDIAKASEPTIKINIRFTPDCAA